MARIATTTGPTFSWINETGGWEAPSDRCFPAKLQFEPVDGEGVGELHDIFPQAVLASTPSILREERDLLELDSTRCVQQETERDIPCLFRRHHGGIALPVRQRFLINSG